MVGVAVKVTGIPGQVVVDDTAIPTAGIAIGAIAADELNLPYAYARPKPKEHGMKNQIEGKIEIGQNIVVIEDLISTGGSSLKVVGHLRETGHSVLGMAAIFTYGFSVADESFKKENPYFIFIF